MMMMMCIPPQRNQESGAGCREGVIMHGQCLDSASNNNNVGVWLGRGMQLSDGWGVGAFLKPLLASMLLVFVLLLSKRATGVPLQWASACLIAWWRLFFSY